MTKSFASICLAMICTACTSSPLQDPNNPYVLNEMAIKELERGSVSSAEVMLERATLLAPHEAVIRRNLETLRAYRSGKNAPLQPMNPTPGRQQTAREAIEMPQTPLWPRQGE